MAKVIIKKTPIDTWQVYLNNEKNIPLNYHIKVLHTFEEALSWCIKNLKMEGEENV